jgi:DNA-binding winged helix-turn-helix (wHTH) protein/TolB-like protein
MNSGRFRFGLFEFDTATLELRREGTIVRLQSQPAKVLCCLIKKPGEVISRENLRQTVWGNDTFVDFERGLNFCVGQIRSTLDDDSVTPRYIRTIPKRGYQFIAPVEPVGESSERMAPVSMKSRNPATAAAVFSAVAILVVMAAGAGYRLRSWAAPKRRPIVAVVRFDNETSDPGLTRFSDGLTDSVVEQLTSWSHGQYDVIGNAHILRLPRDQRDLIAVSSSLHAEYVVLGQVQTSGAQTRILAHLIRLPDQTHLWVARLDRPLADPLGVESEAAQKIVAEFSPRLVRDSSGSRLPPLSNH